MNLEDLHDMEDNFEVFSNEKKAAPAPVKVENNGLTSARRVALTREEDLLGDKWSKYSNKI